jgi:hypothetical protein
MKNRFIIVIILLIVAFLADFVPQYIKANRLENELSAVRQESDLAELRDLAGLAFIQTARRIMGSRQQLATSFLRVLAILRIGCRMKTAAKFCKTCWPLKTRLPPSWRKAPGNRWAISRYCLTRRVKLTVPSAARRGR